MSKGYVRNADRVAASQNGVKHIMGRLKAGYMKKGGHRNKAYADADHRMLEIYLNPGGNK